jgi:hypothetical protein
MVLWMGTENQLVARVMTTKGLHEAAAALFVDSLGRDLPLRERFSYKELHDFLRREGILGLDQLDNRDLVKIGSMIERSTAGNVMVNAEPTAAPTRTPISSIDLRVSGESIPAEPKDPVGVLDLVALHDGTELHVVSAYVGKYVGMDSRMNTRAFELAEVVSAVPMDSSL